MQSPYIIQALPCPTAQGGFPYHLLSRNKAVINPEPGTRLMLAVNKVLPCGSEDSEGWTCSRTQAILSLFALLQHVGQGRPSMCGLPVVVR